MTWIEEQEEKFLKRLQEQNEYMFGLTHYNWMYRALGDKKYLEEQKEYIKKYPDGRIKEDVDEL